MRIPSWTDRVLWKSNVDCTQEHYNCCDEITSSDHSPVFASFSIPIVLPNLPHIHRQCNLLFDNLEVIGVRTSKGELCRLSVHFYSSLIEQESYTPVSDRSIEHSWDAQQVFFIFFYFFFYFFFFILFLFLFIFVFSYFIFYFIFFI